MNFLKVVGAQFKDQLLGSLNFNFTPFEDHYLFDVNDILVRNKEIGDFSIFFKFSENKIYFYNLESNFINSSAFLSGHVKASDFSNICVDFTIEDLSLAAIVFLFAKKEDLDLKGYFNGEGNFCFQNNRMTQLNLEINNLEGGKINLKKKTSLDFLKQRVDKKSYFYLLDNLKNYKYDEGGIEVDIKENDIVFEANFSSKEFGARNIIVKFHNILGGSK